MKALLFIALFIHSVVCFSQATTLKAGVWSDTSVWNNNILPNDSSDVILNYDISIDINATCRSLNTNGHNVIVNSDVTFNIAGDNNFVIDIDGNIYPTVTVGTQTWMTKNLNVNHYRNGDAIPESKDTLPYNNLTGAWCYYQNDSANGIVYGKLYNWYSVIDQRGLAPAGWHVPSDSEWAILANYLGGTLVSYMYAIVGGKMKEVGTAHWASPNSGAVNSSGFSGLPGGSRADFAYFSGIGIHGYWWSSTELNTLFSLFYQLSNNTNSLLRYEDHKTTGSSVRCVKD